MKKHAGEKGALRVLDRQKQGAAKTAVEQRLSVYDATAFVGLRTIVLDAAIKRIEDGEVTFELPKPDELVAAAAVARCLVPVRLKGREMRTIRKIMKLTLVDMAKMLDERTAPETIARWESESQPMGAYAERLFRLIVCEELKQYAPGVDYDASMIATMKVQVDHPDAELPAVKLRLIQLKERSGPIIEAWNVKLAA